jgi:MFS family permease
LLKHYPGRTTLGIVLMASQAFIYNAIFFTYALVLTKFYGVAADRVGLYILPFAVGNFLGPLVLGPLFDTLGRKSMIAATYGLAGVLLAVTGQLFEWGWLSATTQTVSWSVVFFFASAAASAAYLTVGECFCSGARAHPSRCSHLPRHPAGRRRRPVAVRRADREAGRRSEIVYGYWLGAALMIVAAAVELRLGVKAECMPLEDVAPPLSARP